MTGPPDTVFFLSDYGLRDEFCGVVHAVLRRLSPGAAVVDLTHEVPAFDVRAAAGLLARAAPHLGPGVVLAVVDPGVGGGRRNLVLEVPGDPRYLVGPDNGLLLPAAGVLGGVAAAWALPVPEPAPGALAPGTGPSATFDGRDVLAPAAAALCRGEDPAGLGDPVPPGELERLPPPVVEHLVDEGGRRVLRAEVTWVDRYGNVQLAAGPDDLAALRTPDPENRVLAVRADVPSGDPEALGPATARVVRTFADLEGAELGLLVDSSGRLALALREAPASAHLGVVSGDLVLLSPHPGPPPDWTASTTE